MGEVDEHLRFLEELLKSVEEDPSLALTRVAEVPACIAGDNYMSEVTRATVYWTGNTGTQEHSRSLVMKSLPVSVVTRTLLGSHRLVRNEIAAYNGVLEDFRRFFGRKCKHLPFPKCLHPVNTGRSDVIILEDLKPKGFAMADRLVGLTPEECTLALQELARFHSFSLAMKQLDREGFRRTRDKVRESIYVPRGSGFFRAAMENSCKMAVQCLRAQTTDQVHVLEKAIQYLKNLKGNVFESMCGWAKAKEPLSAIIHGDFWINNLLFSYNEDKSLSDVRFVDLQVCRYGPMVLDILHLLYTSTVQETRSQHYNHWIDAYYDALSDSLFYLLKGSPYEKTILVTRENLEQELLDLAMYGLVNALCLMAAVTADPDNVPRLDNIELEQFTKQESVDLQVESQTEEYAVRIVEVVGEFESRGLFQRPLPSED